MLDPAQIAPGPVHPMSLRPRRRLRVLCPHPAGRGDVGRSHRDEGAAEADGECAIDAEARQKLIVMADDVLGTSIAAEGLDQHIDGGEVEVVGGLIEDEELGGRLSQEQRGQGGSEPFPS